MTCVFAVQLGELADKEMEQLANRRGQLAVTLAELNDRTDQDFDVLALLKTYEKALMLWPSTEPFVHRLMVCHTVLSCIAQALCRSVDSCFLGQGQVAVVFVHVLLPLYSSCSITAVSAALSDLFSLANSCT